jgi:hypothetical protein
MNNVVSNSQSMPLKDRMPKEGEIEIREGESVREED